jgi:hypothetical protein
MRQDVVGQWGPCMLKWGSLSNKQMRRKLIGGVIRKAYEEVRVPGDTELKMKVCAWVLRNHGTSLTDAEYNKYIEVFKNLDQSAIDRWLDED